MKLIAGIFCGMALILLTGGCGEDVPQPRDPAQATIDLPQLSPRAIVAESLNPPSDDRMSAAELVVEGLKHCRQLMTKWPEYEEDSKAVNKILTDTMRRIVEQGIEYRAVSEQVEGDMAMVVIRQYKDGKPVEDQPSGLRYLVRAERNAPWRILAPRAAGFVKGHYTHEDYEFDDNAIENWTELDVWYDRQLREMAEEP